MSQNSFFQIELYLMKPQKVHIKVVLNKNWHTPYQKKYYQILHFYFQIRNKA